MAIVAGEGFATEACRALFSNAEKDREYQLFVMHDADPSGYNIARTLREETDRMPGYHVEVIDIGLRLGDALEMGLTPEKFTRLKALPKDLKLNDLERQHFEGQVAAWKEVKGRRVPKAWLCRRVEMNAMTAPQLVDYIIQALRAAGMRGKVIPSEDALPGLTQLIYREAVDAAVRAAVARIVSTDDIVAQLVKTLQGRMGLQDSRKWIEDALAQVPSLSWRGAVNRHLSSALNKQSGEVEAMVWEALKKMIGDSNG